MKKKFLKTLCLITACMLFGSFTACDAETIDSILNEVVDSMANDILSDIISDLEDDDQSEAVSTSEEDSVGEESGEEGDAETSVQELSVHFLTLGNKTSGDCTLIKTGDVEVLIDAGSTTGSIGTIVPYIKEYCTDGVLEYVIATHAHQDHIAGFTNSSSQGKGIFESFECSTIIDFAKTTVTSSLYNEYVSLRDAEVAAGAQHYTALECWNNENGAQSSYTLADGISLNILYQKYYESSTSNENNNSVCVMVSQGENHYLFTGDLEASGEQSLVDSNDLPKCKVYKSAHHGSNTSNSNTLLSVIQPEIVVMTCCCGDKFDFPHQETIDTVALYTSQVYVPCMVSASGGYELLNGNIVVTTAVSEPVKVECSNNNILFKDTDWFKNNRVLPENWK